MRVLVADDNPIDQRVVEAMLQAFGVSPQVVGDGAAALAQVKRAPFDLILMDINMPVMDGLAAISRIRRIEEAEDRPPTPIYVISSSHDQAALRASAKAGADGHLPKPVPMALLLYAVADGLKHRQLPNPPKRPMPFDQAVRPDAASAPTRHTLTLNLGVTS
ncbi:MAG TPA: response regulator [Caulobacteraceae bacterium]|nr:response regulator [Caulobacteraceae bacterium]